MNTPRSVPGPDSLNYQTNATSLAEAEALTTQIDLEEKTNKHRRAEKFRDLFTLAFLLNLHQPSTWGVECAHDS